MCGMRSKRNSTTFMCIKMVIKRQFSQKYSQTIFELQQRCPKWPEFEYSSSRNTVKFHATGFLLSGYTLYSASVKDSAITTQQTWHGEEKRYCMKPVNNFVSIIALFKIISIRKSKRFLSFTVLTLSSPRASVHYI